MQTKHPVVSREEWLQARKALLLKEKEATHLRDRLNAERLRLPWVRVEKEYVFDTAAGPKTLADLFEGRSQLVVYHFMMAPGWGEGCKNCSFVADHLDGTVRHLEHHDVTVTAISRAPLAEIKAYQARMGWRFPWVSSSGNDFNYDFGVSFPEEQLRSGSVAYNYTAIPVGRDFEGPELPGMSAFFRDDEGTVYHTYSSYARGLEELIGTMMILDRAPKGRNEKTTMDFVKRHDEYDREATGASCCHD